MSDEGFRRLVAERGIAARPYLALLEVLAGPGATFDDLVRTTALPRRAVEAALEALGDDVTPAGTPPGDATLRLAPPARAAYADLLPGAGPGAGAAAGGAGTGPGATDAGGVGRANGGPAVGGGAGGGEAGGLPEGLLALVAEAIDAAPRPKRDLDHVAATAETVARRAVYLAGAYALAGRRVLCLGDHDLTSLALAAVAPDAEVAVADLDEDVLAHIASRSPGTGRVTCAFADFRVGLPRRLRNWADLVVTDPPYTPEGVGLFARRGLEALADHGTGRLVVAYGYGDQPGLGLKVQEALAELRLAYEAVLPAFNRYVGAQAIGSASNLYVLRPTAATRRQVARPDRPGAANVYTHGTQALEGGDDPLTPAEAAAVVALAERAAPAPGAGTGGPVGAPGVVRSSGATRPGRAAPAPAVPPRVGLAVGAGWPDGTVAVADGGPAAGPSTATLAACLVPDTPETSPCRGRDDAVVADLRHDAGPLLLRLLLAVEAPRVAVLVRNDHPDIATQAGQEALAAVLAPKFVLRYARSAPGPKLAVVEATTVPPPAEPAGRARRTLLDRPHGKLANAAREAVIRAAATTGAPPLTKNAARALVATHLAHHDLTGPLLELPRASMPTLLADLAATATAAPADA